jgi:hypothetical protein
MTEQHRPVLLANRMGHNGRKTLQLRLHSY